MERYVADFLFLCVAAFFSTNAYNILVTGRQKSQSAAYAEVDRPANILVALAALATFVYFIESGVFLIFFYSSGEAVLSRLPGSLSMPEPFLLQVIGAIPTVVGFALFIWSVSTRGRYSASWAMRSDPRLVTIGPYRYVRHPWYLGYVLMFLGLPLLLQNLVALAPLTGVPGYCVITFAEEELVLKRFGQEHGDYQKRTGRFLPRLSR